MKSKIFRGIVFFLALAIGLGVFGYLIWREGWENIVQTLISFGFWPFIGFVVLSLLNFGLYSWRWQLILNHSVAKKQRLSFWHMYQHRMAGFAVSYLTPVAQAGGEPVRIGMLMTDGVESKRATSSVMLDITIELMAYISFIIAGVILAVITGLSSANTLIAIGAGLIVLLVLLTGFLFGVAKGDGWISKLFLFFRLNKIKSMNKVEGWIKQTEGMMTGLLHAKKSFLFLIAILAITVISFRVVEVFYLAFFFDVNLSFAQAFLVSTLPGIALLLPVPAGLGVFEGGFASLFTILSIPLSAVAFALVIRLRDTIFIGFGVIHLLRKGGKVVQDVIKKRSYASKAD
ncbi:MAG: lysylphosphatidylglycerol synthase transmembrane domain-containing protein [Patescibacteria group bacterium]